ncbi:hypothetical protein PHYPSEUDO_005090 [Phytophthora pseudosyringae]|uniref:Protein kinase domain-containing protein n=1 Tax=Phytophthora pseudosyringae TaxID=221518 RepID=A0A8T1VPT7_9STRA|nr:hypothetical protein PHYPSEUDO_005090 [Phytophthora pseudosyringae]
MALRRELAASADSWAPTGSFSSDGSSSDLALQFYTRSRAGDEIAQLSLSSIPDTVISRLTDVDVTFDDLDGFAQRAVLWDSGFGVTPANEVKQIWTLNGLSMAEIALTLDEYEATTCATSECTQPDGTTAYSNHECTGTTMLTEVKCVVEEFAQTNLGLSMWSIGGESTTIPEIELIKHTWPSADGSEKYTVYAVHTLDSSSEPLYDVCPTTGTYGYLNIPCYGTDRVSASDLTVPTPSDWVTSWAQSFATGTSFTSSSTADSGSSLAGSTSADLQASDPPAQPADDETGTNGALLGGAVGGGLCLLVVIVLVALFVAARRRRKRSESEDQGTPKVAEHAELVTPDAGHRDDRHPRPTLDESLPRSGVTVPVSDDSWSNGGTNRGVPPQYQQAGRRPASAAAEPSPYGNNARYSSQGAVARPPRIHESTRQSVPDAVVQPVAYEGGTRAFGADIAAPPTYEEVLRSSNRSSQTQEVAAPLHLEKIRGLGPNNALQVLAADPSVGRRRLQLDQLQIERQVAMTTLQTDSCVARYNGQQVLLKRLAPGPSVNAAALEDLAFEIQQRAHVGHQNLVQFVGAGWSAAHDLTMVVEFLPRGILRAYLDRNKASWGAWTPQKTAIAGGIARALAYLHTQQPAYIHHDICAKSVLLTDELKAKLASCGSIETNPSVGAKQTSRQAFWVAPEVLNGAPYSPAADIYSFGVFLTELDTCETPYFDARSKSGSTMELADVLALVKEGRLRPSFGAECPQFVRQLGVACCQQDPEKRLTAQQIVQLMEGK